MVCSFVCGLVGHFIAWYSHVCCYNLNGAELPILGLGDCLAIVWPRPGCIVQRAFEICHRLDGGLISVKTVHLPGVSIASVLRSIASCCLIAASGDSSMQVNGGIHHGGTICCCGFSNRLRRIFLYLLSRMLGSWPEGLWTWLLFFKVKSFNHPRQFCFSDEWPSTFNQRSLLEAEILWKLN